MIKCLIYIHLAMFLSTSLLFAQVENLPVSHPVYHFLERYEAMGILPYFSTSDLPLPRKVIAEQLKKIRKYENRLSQSELRYLKEFEDEFLSDNIQRNVLIDSKSDSGSIFFKGIISNNEKYFYYYADSVNSVRFLPLASLDFFVKQSDLGGDLSVALGTLGLRLHGTIDDLLGYYLQATNGAVLSGDRELATEDNRLSHNVKFMRYNSDFDFSESSLRLEKNWFFASIGKETRLLGAGLQQRAFISTLAPTFDAIDLGTKFMQFNYRFTHASLIPYVKDGFNYGFNAKLPPKYMAMHRFALTPSWGEFAFWESVVYSERTVDLGYLNPLSFLKSCEHSLHDRDNSAMGFDLTFRPLSRLQFKGSFLLDDIIFSEIGKSFWSNKTAVNASLMYASPWDFDFGFEYARVEPYTFSHFNYLNSMTHDSAIFAGSLQPNSDQFTFLCRIWHSIRYPIEISMSYRQQGKNIYDENDSLIKNVGSDPLESIRPGDPTKIKFLDGRREYTFLLGISAGIEIIRQFSVHCNYMMKSVNGDINHLIRFTLFFEDF